MKIYFINLHIFSFQPLIDNAQENLYYYIELKKKYTAEDSENKKTEPLSVEPGSCEKQTASPDGNLASATPQE